MLKLFQAVHDAGSTPDYDNDDLREESHYQPLGFIWICYVDKLPTPLDLMTAMVKHLGTVIRGVQLRPEPVPHIEVYLTADYEDEQVDA